VLATFASCRDVEIKDRGPMLQVALLESLRKSGVLSDSQIKGIVSFNDLYMLLVSSGKIPPVSDEELLVCEKVNSIMNDPGFSFEKKIDEISKIANSVKDPVTKGVLDRVVALGRRI